MNLKRNFLVVITALILMCAIPISSSADFVGYVSPYDEDIINFSYNGVSMDASPWPWFHVRMKGYGDNSNITQELVGRIHCRGGHVYKVFLLWIPFAGYYLVVVQDGSLPTDLSWPSDPSHHAIATTHGVYYNPTSNSVNPYYSSAYASYYGDGYLSSQNRGLFQTVLFGHYVIFYRIGGGDFSSQSRSNQDLQYSSDKYGLPTDDETDEILGFIGDNSGTDKPFPGGSAAAEVLDGSKSETPTFPDGSPVPTNEDGNPAPTDEWGETVPTLPNGKPAPTYPNGKPVQTWEDSSGLKHTVPYDAINGEAYPTVRNPDGTVDIVTTTVINNGEVESDARENFSKLRMWVTSLDLFETLASSVYDDVSDKVDDTRGLIDNIFSWFPTWLPAVLMLGMVVILAIKITGR